MRRHGLRILAVAALVAAPDAFAASRLEPVPVAAVDLADAANAVAPVALRGHVVFSRRVLATGRYELVEWTESSGLRVLPVGDRVVAFDADLGLEPDGRILLTWSRCTHDGVDSYPNPSFDFSRARGCRLWSLRLDVSAAVPHHLRLRGDARLSLTTPSVHDGSVVAVAAPRRGSRNVRILLWRKSTRRPVRLRGGTADCPDIPEAYPTCRRGPRTGVDALDLGPRSIAYTWRNPQNGYGTAGGIELRTATLRPSGPTIQVPRTNGFVADGSLRQPSSPTALANGGVGFLLIEEPCFCLHSMLAVAAPDGELWRGVRPSDAVALGAAYDGDRVYWLRGRKLPLAGDIEDPYENGPYPCAAPGVDCRLVVSDALPYRAPTLAR